MQVMDYPRNDESLCLTTHVLCDEANAGQISVEALRLHLIEAIEKATPHALATFSYTCRTTRDN